MRKLFILLSAIFLSASGGMAQNTLTVCASGCDYSTIQAAIDAADPLGGDVIEVSAGTYDEVLLIDKPLTLLGPNANISAVNGTRVAEARLLQRININEDNDVTISGFEFFEVPATSTWTIYIYGNSNNFTFENNRFINIARGAIRSGDGASTGNLTVTGNLVEGISTNDRGISFGGIYGNSTISNNKLDLAFNGIPTGVIGILTPGANNLTISGNEVSNVVTQGIQLSGACGDVVIENNNIDNTNTSNGADRGAIRLYGTAFTGPVVINNNILTNSFNGVAVRDGEDLTGKDITITNNNLTGNSNKAIYNGASAGELNAPCNWFGAVEPDFSTLIDGEVNYTPWLVTDNLTSTTNCTGALVKVFEGDGTTFVSGHATIQGAIDDASTLAGYVIEVAAGTYEEILIIDKSITLNGPNYDKTGYAPDRVNEAIIQYPASLTSGNYSLATIDAENVNIIGFTFNDNISVGLTYDASWPPPMLVGGVLSNESNTLIENNRFLGFNSIAVRMTQPNAANPGTTVAKVDNTTRYNYFEGGTVYHSIYYQASGGVIEHNHLVNAGSGIQVQPYRSNAKGTVSNNEFSVYISGLYYNYANWTIDGDALWSFTDNEVTAPSVAPVWDELVWDAAPRAFDGIRVETYLQDSAPPSFEPKANFVNNTIDADGADNASGWLAVRGIYFRNVKGDAATNVQNITFSDNTFSNVEIGAQFDDATSVEHELDELYGNGNTYPTGMFVIEPYQIGDAQVVNTTQNLGYTTIQAAIDDANPAGGDVITVAAGNYDENVVVNKPVTLLGANADVPCDSRGSESVIAPSSGLPISVTADGVTINGFEITASAYQYAISCGNTSNLTISYNNIHNIGTLITNTNVHSILYMVANAASTSNVNILDNCFNNISSASLTGYSASAIGVLQSSSTGVLTGLNIERNTINEVNVNTGNWPTGKLAYGILINTGGGGTYLTSDGKVVDAVISQNEITNLSGFISTGIGLEGNTENVIVENNYVAILAGNKVGTREGGGYDLQALKFEKNRYVGTATVQNNSFAASTFTHSDPNGVGYAVANYVPVGGSYSGGTTAALELGCNWYDTAVFTEIEDNATLTGRILNKADCETTFVPYLVDGTDDAPGTLGFQPVPGSCEGYPDGTVFVLDSNGEIIDFFFGNGAIAAAIASAVDGETVLIASGNYNEDIDASGMPDPSLTISIGESPGCVTVTGLTLTNNDTWLQEIEDYDPCTGYDQLTVNGNVDLGGATLDGQLLGGFVPAPGWEFEIVNFTGTLTGQFAEGTSITIDGQSFEIDYGANSVKLIPQGYANYVWYDDQGNALNDGMTIDIDVEACQEVTVVVKLETEGPITTTDLKLNFDPNHLQVISIDGLAIFDEDDAIAGDLFGVGSPSYNNTSGEIYYATTSIGVFNSNSVSVSANYMTITFRAERNDSDNGDGTLTADNTTYTTSIEAVDIGVLGGTRIMNNFGFVPGGFEPLVTNVMLDAETLDVDITPDNTDPVINDNGICLSLDDARFINVPGESLYQVDGTEFDVITSATDDCTTPTITHNAGSIIDAVAGTNFASLDGWQLPVGTHTITFTASDGFNTVPCEVEITVEHQTLTGSAIINMGCNVGAPVRIRVYDGMTQVGTDFTTTLIAGGDFAAPIELIGVPAGTYTVIAEIDRYLAKGFTVNMTSSSAQPNIVLTQVIPGDIAGDTAPYNDNVINGVDLSLVISNYNTISSQSGFNNRPDLNCDNQVDAIDLSFVSFYYFTQGASPQ